MTGASRASDRAFTRAAAGPAGGSGLILLAICPAAFIAVLNSYALGPYCLQVASNPQAGRGASANENSILFGVTIVVHPG